MVPRNPHGAEAYVSYYQPSRSSLTGKIAHHGLTEYHYSLSYSVISQAVAGSESSYLNVELRQLGEVHYHCPSYVVIDETALD